MNKQNEALEEKYKEEERRCQSLTKDYQKIESLLVDKDKLIESQARRLQDLEKANEIFKYRIVEMKSQHDPKE